MAVLTPSQIMLGDPVSEDHETDRIAMADWMNRIETQLALSGYLAFFEDTLTDLEATSPSDGDTGFVVYDGTNNGVYQYQTDTWVKTAELPAGFAMALIGVSDLPDDIPLSKIDTPISTENVVVELESVGGTGDAITAELPSEYGAIETLPVGMVYLLQVGETNTGDVTLDIGDGNGAVSLLTGDGGEIPAGALVAGDWLILRRGTTSFRLVGSWIGNVEKNADRTTVTNVKDALNNIVQTSYTNLGNTDDRILVSVAGAINDWRWVQPSHFLRGIIKNSNELPDHTEVVDDDVFIMSSSADGNEGVRLSAINLWEQYLEAKADALIPDAYRMVYRVQPGRVGQNDQNFAGESAGAGVSLSAVPGTSVVLVGEGEARRLTGAGLVAMRDALHIGNAEAVTVVFRFRRETDPTDPAGDTVRTGIAWLDEDRTLVSVEQVEDVTLEVADGEHVRTLEVYEASAPAGAVYMRPIVQTYGLDGVTDVSLVQIGVPQSMMPPAFAEVEVARTFYVTMDGDDTNEGTSLSSPLATPGAAIQKMADLGLPCVTIVHPGTYEVAPDTDVPDNCAVYGYDAFVTFFDLPTGQEENNMLRIGSGTKIRGITFRNLRHEEYDFDPETQTYDPPRKGYAISWRPGAFITRLPYVMDCAMRPAVADDQDAMFAPLDRANGNPLMPRGGGCMIADPSVIDPNSPQKLMAAFSFTPVNPNGVAYTVLDDAFMQLVSVYTNYSRIGFWAHNGGQTTVKNGDCTFGDWSFVATGYRRTIRIPDDIVTAPAADSVQAAAIEDNADAILTNAEGRWTAREWWSSLNSQQREYTRRDARTLLDFLAGDRASGQALGVQAFTKGLFDANADYVFLPSLLTAFLESFDDIEDAIVEVTGTSRTPISTLLSVPATVLASPDDYRVNIGSRCLAQPHGMTNCGGGVNYNARPFQFRGTAFVPPPDETILEYDGGLVDIMWLQEQGDMRLARDLYVDADRSIIEGQAFRRSIQATTLPLTIALGGL